MINLVIEHSGTQETLDLAVSLKDMMDMYISEADASLVVGEPISPIDGITLYEQKDEGLNKIITLTSKPTLQNLEQIIRLI